MTVGGSSYNTFQINIWPLMSCGKNEKRALMKLFKKLHKFFFNFFCKKLTFLSYFALFSSNMIFLFPLSISFVLFLMSSHFLPSFLRTAAAATNRRNPSFPARAQSSSNPPASSLVPSPLFYGGEERFESGIKLIKAPL